MLNVFTLRRLVGRNLLSLVESMQEQRSFLVPVGRPDGRGARASL